MGIKALRLLALLAATSATMAQGQQLSARDLVQAAMDNFRGLSSQGEMTMVIHRSDWERSMTMQAWTAGTEESLVRVVEPKKDAGNATLVKGDQMWTYAPGVNRVLKIPSSMMGQSWMGSDFSNKDVARSADIIDEYDHTLIGTEESGGHVVYTIESIPHEDAPIVWGKEVISVRDDFVFLEHQFWSQDGELVKVMKGLDIGELGGRPMAKRMRMTKQGTPEEWTEIIQQSIAFDVDLPASVFTLSNLRNPRQ